MARKKITLCYILPVVKRLVKRIPVDKYLNFRKENAKFKINFF